MESLCNVGVEIRLEIERLIELMARLRDPDGGCPWDREQTFATIAPYTLEEAYEVADAIERDEFGELRDELGDLLFQVVFHARMAEEAGLFGFADVVTSIVDKMTRRHPHVFGDVEMRDAEAQTRAWEAQKAQERANRAEGEHSVLDGVPVSLPALVRAEKLQKRAARVGFDWTEPTGVLEKVGEELEEVRAELAAGDRDRLHQELGDLLFSCVNLARHTGVDPEGALRAASNRFERRFRGVESHLRRGGRTPEQATLEEMDVLWEQVKTAEKSKD